MSRDLSALPSGAAGPDPRARLTERMSIALQQRGMPLMAARVLVVVLCHDRDTVTAKQLSAELGVSGGAISAAVNHLMRAGILVREPVPGSRQEHYRLPPGGVPEALMCTSSAAQDLAAIATDGVALMGGAGTPGGARLTEVAELIRLVDEHTRGVGQRWQTRQEQRATVPALPQG